MSAMVTVIIIALQRTCAVPYQCDSQFNQFALINISLSFINTVNNFNTLLLGLSLLLLIKILKQRCNITKLHRSKNIQSGPENIYLFYFCDNFRKCTPILTFFSLLEQEIYGAG